MSAYARSIADYGGAIVALAPRAERWPAELPDNRAGARLVTEHLLSLGHVGIAMIGGPATLRTSRERELGYADAMKVAGCKPNIVAADFTVFVASDTMALGTLAELRRQGLRVPEDVSVVGFDDIPGLEFIHPSLTTVRVPMAELGAAGVARLLHELDGERHGTRVRLHPVELVVRESTGPPKRGD
jgi:DNA-binding LacI/PurR family transcriptional regulator